MYSKIVHTYLKCKIGSPNKRHQAMPVVFIDNESLSTVSYSSAESGNNGHKCVTPTGKIQLLNHAPHNLEY